jgi:hypothetical protein
MNDLMQKNRLKITLVSLISLFLAIMIYELARTRNMDVNHLPDNPANEDINLVNKAITIPPLQYYAAITDRPLFYEERKPIVFAEPEKQKAKTSFIKKRTKPDQYYLSGIIITPDAKLAVIRDATGKNTERLSMGDTYSGWTLTQIEPLKVTLRKGDQEKVLELSVKPSLDNVNSLFDRPGNTQKNQTILDGLGNRKDSGLVNEAIEVGLDEEND